MTNPTNKSGYIYILSNPSMPNLVKIGMTRRGALERASELYTTGVPTPFNLEFEMYMPDCEDAERYIHDSLDHLRVSYSREFFKIDVENAIITCTDQLLSEYDMRSIAGDFYDVKYHVTEMLNKINYESTYYNALKMYSALEYIDETSLLKAMVKYEIITEERIKRRELKRLNND